MHPHISQGDKLHTCRASWFNPTASEFSHDDPPDMLVVACYREARFSSTRFSLRLMHFATATRSNLAAPPEFSWDPLNSQHHLPLQRMIRSSPTPCFQGYPQWSFLKALLNPQVLISRRGISVIRYVSDPWEGTKKTPHFIQPEKIQRAGHRIPWEADRGMTAFENLRTKYIDTYSHMHTTLQEMKDVCINHPPGPLSCFGNWHKLLTRCPGY